MWLQFAFFRVHVSDNCAHKAALVLVVSPFSFNLQIMISHNAVSLIVSCVPMFCAFLPPPFCVSTVYSIMQCDWTFLCHRLSVSLLCLSLTTFIVLIAFQMFRSHAFLIPNFPVPVLFFSSCCFALLYFAAPLPADLSRVFSTVCRE